MVSTVRLGVVDLCYELFGSPQDPTIVLISGLGNQMIRWEDDFCLGLVAQGFQVVRFDNRDSGCSVYDVPANFPVVGNVAEAFSKIKPSAIPYTLLDMAKDVIGLLDHLQLEKVHLVGRSMGGIISQLLAAHFSERVLSIGLIMTTSLHPDLPPTSAAIMALLTSPRPNPAEDKAGYLSECYRFTVAISGGQFVVDRDTEYAMLNAELNRSKAKNGTLRQLLAMGCWTYDADLFAKIKVPTLVIHGTEDPIFHVDSAHDLHRSIAKAELLLLEGMGHNLPIALFESIAKSIAQNAFRIYAN